MHLLDSYGQFTVLLGFIFGRKKQDYTYPHTKVTFPKKLNNTGTIAETDHVVPEEGLGVLADELARLRDAFCSESLGYCSSD